MTIYNYQYQSKHSNAVIIISVRTDKGLEIASAIAEDELNLALKADEWYVEEISEEVY